MLSRRLREIMYARNISLLKLSEMSGVPMETLRNIYYQKVHDPKVSTVLGISEALGVTMNYLMGRSMCHDDETEIIKNYRSCGIHGKGMIRITARFECMAAYKERSNAQSHRIPCIIPIGKVKDGIDYNSCDVEDLYTTAKHAYLAIKITSNYFAPSYCEGDRLLFENRFPDHNEHAVFTDGTKCYFRRYMEMDGNYCLQCLNGHGEDIVLKRMDSMQCIGTCIGVMRS
ncbi:MAG: helix-turn-helix transcriptional regulator [Hespellia sp.]|nr:helix-turn-helix transcriptional regulator [Hespellia sp.]